MKSERIKYPRTKHLPWSLGRTKDDKVLKNVDCFIGKTVIASEKMDGENSTIARDYSHARSLDSNHHESRSFLKGLHGSIKHDIPEGWRICGENMFAQHSIRYEGLKSCFYVFSIWDETNHCLSWLDTVEYCEMLGLTPVKVLYCGIFDETAIKNIHVDPETMEGYVVRNIESFPFKAFGENCAKFVRKGHVTTDTHWMHSKVIANGLK